MRRHLPLIGFVLSVAVLAYGAGFFSQLKGWWPAKLIVEAYVTAEDLPKHWRNDFGIEPTRFLVPVDNQTDQPIQVLDAERMAPGLRFVSGLTPNRDSNVGAMLLDAAGNEVHFWPIRYRELAPGGESPMNVMLHGIEPLPDGSIIVSFDNGDVVARINACGSVMWATPGRFHHTIGLSDTGTLWVWEYKTVPEEMRKKNRKRPEPRREHLVEIDQATGTRLREISLEDDIVGSRAFVGGFALHTEDDQDKLAYCCDHFHPNDAKPLPAALARAFPMFRAGDLMISLRSLNMIAVLDKDTMDVKWSQIGPWHRQHDPDFLPDGTISVFNNNMGLGASQVIVMDPATRDFRVAFDGRESNFYTWQRGRHETLPNGNIMLVETERGRVLEVTPEGDVVWAFDNVYDRGRNGLVNEARILSPNYFTHGALSCRPTS
jgi:hypothetical protein